MVRTIVLWATKKKIGGQRDILEEIEEELKNHILKLEETLFGITPLELRSLAYQVAERNCVAHRFNKDKKIAGKKWHYAFMKRHSELSLRQPESTSLARARGFSKSRVFEFFDVLEKLVDQNKLDATRVFNADETGLSTVQKRTRKVIARKGKHQVGSHFSGEPGTLTVAVCCVSMSGNYVPPMLIFKRARGKNEIKGDAPPGSNFAFNPESSYIKKEGTVLGLDESFYQFSKILEGKECSGSTRQPLNPY
jgi:hypothetical protein